jgi:hypothetical protein
MKIIITIVVIAIYVVIQVYMYSTRKYVCCECRYTLRWTETTGGSRFIPPQLILFKHAQIANEKPRSKF